jgi:hypothetical protein
MNGCIHLCTTVQAYFYSAIFEKGLAQQRFLGVALLANNLYQRAWARRQIGAAEPRLYPTIYLSQESREQPRSCKSFPDLKLGYCPQCVTATLAAKRQSGSDPSMSLITARSIRHL